MYKFSGDILHFEYLLLNTVFVRTKRIIKHNRKLPCGDWKRVFLLLTFSGANIVIEIVVETNWSFFVNIWVLKNVFIV